MEELWESVVLEDLEGILFLLLFLCPICVLIAGIRLKIDMTLSPFSEKGYLKGKGEEFLTARKDFFTGNGGFFLTFSFLK